MTKFNFYGNAWFFSDGFKGLLADRAMKFGSCDAQTASRSQKEIRMTPVKQVALDIDYPVLQPEKLSGSPEWKRSYH